MDHKNKYEEALERAKQGLPMDEVFPELKESEDERIRTRLIALVEAFGQGKYKDEMLTYLERQKGQKPAKWSEEDEKLLDFWLDVIDRNDWRMDENFCKASREFINRLKFLRPQPHWKPSEEQIEWLESAVKLSTDKPHIHGIIISLYEQLKRL